LVKTVKMSLTNLLPLLSVDGQIKNRKKTPGI